MLKMANYKRMRSKERKLDVPTATKNPLVCVLKLMILAEPDLRVGVCVQTQVCGGMRRGGGVGGGRRTINNNPIWWLSYQKPEQVHEHWVSLFSGVGKYS